MSVSEWFQSQRQTYRHRIQKLVLRNDKFLNFGGEYVVVEHLLYLFQQISVKFGFVSVNGVRETYFMDTLLINPIK